MNTKIKDRDLIIKGFASIKKDISGLKKDVGELKIKVGMLEKDVSELKKDVSGLKDEVSGLRTEMVNMEGRLSTKIETEVENLARMAQEEFMIIHEQIDEIKERVPV